MTLQPAITAKIPGRWAGRLGVWTSTLCVVHCLVTPVLISMSAVAAHFLPLEERVHRSLALAIALVGTFAIIRGFRRHYRVPVLSLMTAGLTCIFLAAFLGDRLPSHGTRLPSPPWAASS